MLSNRLEEITMQRYFGNDDTVAYLTIQHGFNKMQWPEEKSELKGCSKVNGTLPLLTDALLEMNFNDTIFHNRIESFCCFLRPEILIARECLTRTIISREK